MLLAAVVGLGVALLPGVVLALTVGPGRDRWLLLAASPALTLGLVTFSMAWLPRVGLPHGASAVLVSELLLAVVVTATAGLLRWRRSRAARATDTRDVLGPDPFHTSTVPRLRGHLPDALALGLAGLLSVGYGWLVTGRMNAAPGWDAMNHGFLTRRILDTASTAIPDVCTTGVTDPAVACRIYPLATNVTWAQTSAISGARISDVLMAWVIVVGPVALVAGVYAAVRVFGVSPVIAGSAALAPAFLGPVWTSMLIGRPTQQFGPSLVPAIALLVVAAARGPRPWRMGAMAGLAGAGLVMSHTYDALFVPLLALGVVLALRPLALRLGTVLKAALSLAVVSVAASAPFLARLASAEGVLAQTPPRYVGKFGEGFSYWVLDPMRYVLLGYPAPEATSNAPLDVLPVQIALWATVVALVASPLCLFIRPLRWVRPWLLLWLVVTALGIWTSTSDAPFAQSIAGLWYGTRDRLRAVLLADYAVLAVGGACVVGYLVARAAGVGRRDRATRQRLVTVLTAASAGAFVVTMGAMAGQPEVWRPLHDDLRRRTPDSPAYPRVFAWLAEHTPSGGVVAYDKNRELLSWSYSDYGVGPLFGMTPHTEPGSEANYRDRTAAWDWLVDNPGAEPAGCEVQRFGVRYIVSSTSVVPGPWRQNYDRKRLAASPHVRPVHTDGPITVYEVTPDGAECAEST